MTDLRIIACCVLVLAGALACGESAAQTPASAAANGQPASGSAADRAQKESDRTLYWIRMLAEKPAPKPAAAAPKPAPARPAATATASEARPAAVKVPAATGNRAGGAASAPPAATTPTAPGVAATESTAAANGATTGADPGVASPADSGALAAPPVDAAAASAPEEEAPDPGLVMTQSADPQFPMNVMRRLRKGQVEVRFEVGPDGQVDVVSVVKSSSASLNDAALDAVRQWRFKPTPHGHTAVVDLAFNLDS